MNSEKYDIMNSRYEKACHTFGSILCLASNSYSTM